MCMGKGGVGKTTIAAAIAVALAHRGHPVQLTTTDPAAHLSETLQGAVTGLTVSRIDPVEATAEYRDRVMAAKGKHLDEAAGPPWPRTCAPRAPRRSRCSRSSPARSPNPAAATS